MSRFLQVVFRIPADSGDIFVKMSATKSDEKRKNVKRKTKQTVDGADCSLMTTSRARVHCSLSSASLAVNKNLICFDTIRMGSKSVQYLGNEKFYDRL